MTSSRRSAAMIKEYFYTDELNDDFAATNGKIGRDVVDGEYKYSRYSIGWKIVSFIVYRLFVTPLVWAYVKLWLGITVKNRKGIRSLKDGCFLYLNHTQDICDAFIPTIAAFPKKTYIVTGPETVSIKGIRLLVAMLGAIPLPTTFSAAKHYEKKLYEAIEERAAVTIFPEAHIWPYCNFVRHFSEKSFSYPYKTDAPVIAGVVVYRQRRIFKNAHPRAVVYLSDPLYPDHTLSEKEARRKLRDEAYDFMSRTAREQQSYEYIRYTKIADIDDSTQTT